MSDYKTDGTQFPKSSVFAKWLWGFQHLGTFCDKSGTPVIETAVCRRPKIET